MNALSSMFCATVLLAAMPSTPAAADQLRNVQPGEPIPAFSLSTMAGDKVSLADFQGQAVILVFLSAQQRSSEAAAAEAHAVVRELRRDDVTLIYATADTAQAPYFRRLRDQANLHEPLGLDFDRQLYGDLGLIVLPTTIVVDPAGNLAHVIASRKSDYKHVLIAYVEHALGELDEAALQRRLAAATFRRDRPEDKIARHRAAARILRRSGLVPDAEKELRAALALDPAHADAQLDLAALLVTTKRLEEAQVIVATVNAEHPDHRRGKLMHGVVLYEAGELEEAKAVLEEVLVLNPDPIQTHYYLGLIYEAQGDRTRAIEHYRQSLSRLLDGRPL